MGYKLAEQNGESVAVPRLVFSHLGRADGDTVRVALYLLSRISVCGADNAKYLNACFEELNRLRDSLQQETNTQEGA